MAKVIINTDACKGCGLCIIACPKKILQLSQEKFNVKGYAPCECVDQSQCIGCAACARMCPDCVIEVEK